MFSAILRNGRITMCSCESKGIADIPFFWHTPIKHQRAGGNFSQLKGDLPLEQPEALPEAIAGDAAADGIELGDQAVHRLALSQGI